MADRKALEREIKELVKRANESLERLEGASLTKASNAYRYVERKAHDGDSAFKYNKRGQARFSGKVLGKSYQDLQHAKAELDRFVKQASTSTVRGTKAAHASRFKSYQKTHKGSGITMDQYGDMWRNKKTKVWASMYGSESAVDLYSKAIDAGLSDQDIQDLEFPEGSDYADMIESIENAAYENKSLDEIIDGEDWGDASDIWEGFF